MVEAETLSRNRICQCTRRTWRAYRGNSFTPSYLTFCLSKQTLNYRKIPQYYTPWVISQKFTFHFYYSKKFQEFHPKYVNRFMFAFLFWIAQQTPFLNVIGACEHGSNWEYNNQHQAHTCNYSWGKPAMLSVVFDDVLNTLSHEILHR